MCLSNKKDHMQTFKIVRVDRENWTPNGYCGPSHWLNGHPAHFPKASVKVRRCTLEPSQAPSVLIGRSSLSALDADSRWVPMASLVGFDALFTEKGSKWNQCPEWWEQAILVELGHFLRIVNIGYWIWCLPILYFKNSELHDIKVRNMFRSFFQVKDITL